MKKAPELKPGRELDALVAEKVFGWRLYNYDESRFAETERDYEDASYMDGWVWERDTITREAYQFKPSSSIADAWAIVDKFAPIVGDVSQADGFFSLIYGEGADHSRLPDCQPGDIQADEDDNDLAPWSAHFHPGLSCMGSEAAKLWGDLENHRWYCARGETAEHAICLAALRAVGAIE